MGEGGYAVTESLALFDVETQGKVRHDSPQTSVDAARSITGRTEAAILAEFRMGRVEGDDGCTDDELCARLPRIFPPTVKSARSRLSNKGFLVASGTTRPSSRGRDSIVWRLGSESRA